MSEVKPISDADLERLDVLVSSLSTHALVNAVVRLWPAIRARITELKELAEHQDRCIACREGEIEEEQKVVQRLSARIADLEQENDKLVKLVSSMMLGTKPGPL